MQSAGVCLRGPFLKSHGPVAVRFNLHFFKRTFSGIMADRFCEPLYIAGYGNYVSVRD